MCTQKNYACNVCSGRVIMERTLAFELFHTTRWFLLQWRYFSLLSILFPMTSPLDQCECHLNCLTFLVIRSDKNWRIERVRNSFFWWERALCIGLKSGTICKILTPRSAMSNKTKKVGFTKRKQSSFNRENVWNASTLLKLVLGHLSTLMFDNHRWHRLRELK